MILRKPYAFLIKNFKLIHGIVLFLMIIFFILFNNTYLFFRDYVDLALYQQVLSAVSEHFSLALFLIYILIIAILSMISFLLRSKEKPVRVYNIANIFYIITIVPLISALVTLNAIQMNSISIQLIRVTRDILMLGLYLQIPFMLMILSRTVGFNIKKFNFEKDLLEIAVDEADSAEFEVEVDIDAEDFRAKFNRRKRVIRYVFLENKLLITIASSVIIFTILISTYLYFGIVKKIYHENENFNADGLLVKVVDTYQTKTTSSGRTLFKNDFIVAVTMSFKNRTDTAQTVPMEHIFLRTDETSKYEPYQKNRYELADLGRRYLPSYTIKAGETAEYVFIYRVDDEFREISKRLEYLDSVSSKDNELKFNYHKVQLKAKEYDELKIDSEYKLGEEINFIGSSLKSTSFKASSFDMDSRYYPEYKEVDPSTKEVKTYNTIVSPTHDDLDDKIVARVKVNIKVDEALDPSASLSFFERYGKLTYVIDGKEIKHKEPLYNIDPSSNNAYVYFEVSKKVATAEKIYVDFVIKNKAYRYHLLENNE